jgi:hypothetical protein
MRTRLLLVKCFLAGVLVSGCSTSTKAEIEVKKADKEAKKAERAEYVAKALDDRRYKIGIDLMITRRMGSKPVTSDWELEVKGDTLVSYLPYFGVAYEAAYGSSTGLNFTAPIKSYEDSGFNKGKRTIRLRTYSDEDVIDYQIEVMDNGSASIDVTPRKREGISYSGTLEE